jgi:ADP-heptose:LPS heptosyltransferase
MAQKNDRKSLTVLVTRFSAVGDIAMSIPMLYSLCRSYPQHRFIFASRERFGQFFINKPENLEFIGINTDEFKGFSGLFRLYRKLRKEFHPDIYADLHDVLRTKILRFYFNVFGRTKCRHIIKGRKEKRALTRRDNKCRNELKSTFERYRDVFTRSGLPFEPRFTSLFNGGRSDIGDFAGTIPQKGNDKWIGIAPFAKHNGKIYPIEKMEQVVERLSAHPGVRIFFFGNGPEEEKVVNGWCSKYPRTASFIGKSNFNGEIRFINHLDVMVCMDSANMHIASLAGTPAISIWGATSPLAGFLGWEQQREDCIELPLECRPCSIFGNKPCIHGDYRCMNIEPQAIIERIARKIGLA